MTFELRRPNHAIGEFHASVTLVQPVSLTTFSAVLAELESIRQTLVLPAAMAIQTLEFAIGPNGPTPASSGPSPVGFQRFLPTGEVAESLMCDPNSIIYVSHDYTAWTEVEPKLLSIFDRLLKHYSREIPAVREVKLQYLNEFRGGTIRSDVGSVVRPGSRWIPAFADGQTEPWHSHVGLFLSQSGNRRDLVNVNADLKHQRFGGELSERDHLQILILTAAFYNVIGKPPLVLTPTTTMSVLHTVLDELHTLEKTVLREVITDEYLTKMGAL